MVIKHPTVKAPGQTLAAVADWNADHTGTATPEAHTLASHSTKAHAELTNVTSDQHHAQLHNAASHTDIASTGAQIDDAVAKKHDRQHAITTAADHTSAATPGQILKADANGLPIDATNTDGEVSGAVTASHAAVTLNASATTGGLSLAAQEISNRAATNVQTGYATAAQITAIEANTLKDTNVTTDLSAGARTATTIKVDSSDGTDATLVEADTTNAGILGSDKWDEIVANSLKDTNVTTDLSAGARTATTIKVDSSDGTDANLVEADTTNAGILGSDKWDEIVANTAAKHTQNTDTILGTDCVALDHGAAATDMVINVCYGTGDPPAANTTTEGALFVKYTA